MSNMQKTLLTLFLLGSTFASGQGQVRKTLISYSWTYGGAVHGTIQVPPGYIAETKNYKEGIITYLRYSDSSYIVLQHGGMYRVPMFQGSDYLISRTDERFDRIVRMGSLKTSKKVWREDNLKKLPSPRGNLQPLSDLFPPNIAYDNVANDSTELFNEALNSFVWNTKS